MPKLLINIFILFAILPASTIASTTIPNQTSMNSNKLNQLNALSVISAQSSKTLKKTNLVEKQIGPWTVICLNSKTQYQQNSQNKTKSLHLKICKAQQTIAQSDRKNAIKATATISSLITNFTIMNTLADDNSAILVIGNNQPLKLNVFCNKSSNKKLCTFMIQNDQVSNDKILSMMTQASSFKINFLVKNKHQSVTLVFSLDRFSDVHAIIKNADNGTKNLLTNLDIQTDS